MVLLENVVPPSGGVRHKQPETTAFLDGKELGPGTLYVAETRLSWFDGSGIGFSLEYPSISLHAISREKSAYPQEHLYLMVNAKFNGDSEMCNKTEVDEELEEDDDDDDSDDEGHSLGPATEIRLVPSDKASLGPMFSAMCECQALHPDPEDSDSDFEGDEYDVEEAEQGQGLLPDLCTYEEGLSHVTTEGQVTPELLEDMLDQPGVQKGCMNGVQTEGSSAGQEGEVPADVVPTTVSGQCGDADVDH